MYSKNLNKTNVISTFSTISLRNQVCRDIPISKYVILGSSPRAWPDLSSAVVPKCTSFAWPKFLIARRASQQAPRKKKGGAEEKKKKGKERY